MPRCIERGLEGTGVAAPVGRRCSLFLSKERVGKGAEGRGKAR